MPAKVAKVDNEDRPHYRAKAQLYLDRLIEEGENFHSDDVPGKHWEPLNDAAEAAIRARAAVKAASARQFSVPVAARHDDPDETRAKLEEAELAVLEANERADAAAAATAALQAQVDELTKAATPKE